MSIGAFGFDVTCGSLSYEWGVFVDSTGTRSCSAAHANAPVDRNALGGFDTL